MKEFLLSKKAFLPLCGGQCGIRKWLKKVLLIASFDRSIRLRGSRYTCYFTYAPKSSCCKFVKNERLGFLDSLGDFSLSRREKVPAGRTARMSEKLFFKKAAFPTLLPILYSLSNKPLSFYRKPAMSPSHHSRKFSASPVPPSFTPLNASSMSLLGLG